MTCPLCQIPQGEVLVDHPRWQIARTKHLKGHKERIMLYIRGHDGFLANEQEIGEAYMYLFLIGQKLFSYTRYWTILEPTYATVPDHWHRVASDLDSNSEDYEQILRTPRLVIDNELIKLERAKAPE